MPCWIGKSSMTESTRTTSAADNARTNAIKFFGDEVHVQSYCTYGVPGECWVHCNIKRGRIKKYGLGISDGML